MRGAGLCEVGAQFQAGIIPACAGSRQAVEERPNVQRDHPRVCGEQAQLRAVVELGVGSSPRVRGAVRSPTKTSEDEGIIPACAGSSAGACTGLLTGRDHPRVCGEQRLKKSVIKTPSGSSPRVRGAVERELLTGQRLGIIPACAGSRRLKKVQ